MPIRSCYATDSASMMGKAIQLIKAVEHLETQKKQGKKATTKNPFKKAWGLQTDGDLWQQAWLAVVKRGPRNQSLRKVKGHATMEDIQKGISNAEDKKGNGKRDEQADEGVENIQGRGLVKLASWVANRHDKYGTFMKRVHKFIAGVLIAEKKREEQKISKCAK